ncbi:MAG: hypothetical protein WKF37_09855 [Bryobacteraceae bacterium]
MTTPLAATATPRLEGRAAIVVIREQMREGRDSIGRKLIDVRATPSRLRHHLH